MTNRADAHIHLFAGGFRYKSFASRPGVTIDEAACFASLAREHNVTAALVIGYGGEDWCTENNEHLAEQSKRYDWIRPVAYIANDALLTDQDLENWQQQGFVGVSLYVSGDDVERLERIPDIAWRWLEQRKWLVSVNSEGDAWRAWESVLARFPELRLLVSHLGQPAVASSAPGRQQAAEALRPVIELAKFPGVHVKLSGFYALTAPGHDYPHQAAWAYVEQLVESFSCNRLLWGSDFIPCLDWITYPQTLDVFGKIPFLSEADVAQITGGNLLALLTKI